MVWATRSVLLSVAILIPALTQADCKTNERSFGYVCLESRPAEQDQSTKDPWLSDDKLNHFFASAMITGFGYFVGREPLNKSEDFSLLIGTTVSLSAGVGKEYYDSRTEKGRASVKDIIADVLGVGLALFLIKIT